MKHVNSDSEEESIDEEGQEEVPVINLNEKE